MPDSTQPPGRDQTIREAKAYLRAHFEKGVECPCCGKHVKLYKRGLTGAMAVGLCLLKRYNDAFPEQFVHIEDHFKNIEGLSSSVRGDVAKLRHWGLIEPWQARREDGSKRAGLWRITALGARFVDGKVKVPAHVLIYNDIFLGFSDEHVTIQQAMGKKFNYREIMADSRLEPASHAAHRADDLWRGKDRVS